MPSQTELMQRLKQATDPTQKGALALELLQASRKREMVDTALAALESADPGDSARPVLRERAQFYFEHPAKDAGGLLREKLLRLLVNIGHPDDLSLYLRGAACYESQLGLDVTQKLRAVALIGICAVDPPLGRAYAVRLLGEPDTSPLSGEPSATALNVLASLDERLPVFGFIRLAGRALIENRLSDLVGKAFELLGAAFPATLFAELAAEYSALDVSPVSAGIINAIIERRDAALYPLLEQIITQTRDADLHRYGLIMMAAARDDTLRDRLYALARFSPLARVDHFIEALELTSGSARDSLLDSLRARKSGRR